MTSVWMTPIKNGQCEILVRRDATNKIVVATQTPLTDDQVEELFMVVSVLTRSGKTLGEQLEIVRCKDCKMQECEGRNGMIVCDITGESHDPDWFCADGEHK